MIRQNPKTGECSLDLLNWGLIPYWCNDLKGDRKTARRSTPRARPSVAADHVSVHYNADFGSLDGGPRVVKKIGTGTRGSVVQRAS